MFWLVSPGKAVMPSAVSDRVVLSHPKLTVIPGISADSHP